MGQSKVSCHCLPGGHIQGHWGVFIVVHGSEGLKVFYWKFNFINLFYLQYARATITRPLFIDEPVRVEEIKPLKDEVDLAKLGKPPAEKKEVFETLPYFTQVTKDVVVQEGKYARKLDSIFVLDKIAAASTVCACHVYIELYFDHD